MQLLNPGMLIALGLIPILLLIHALTARPKQIEVTNLFLWEEVLRERSSNLTLKRVKRNLPLLLQILIVILAAIALARPVWLYFTQKKGDMILVVDTSASMKTKVASGTRFSLAIEKTLELIDQRTGHQKILIIEAGNKPVLQSGYLKDANQAKNIVQGIKASDAPGKLEHAVYLALSFVDPGKNDNIYLITDGAGIDLSKLLQIHPRIIPVVISGGKKNIGITKFEFRQEFDRKNNYEIMLEIKNFTPKPVDCPIRLTIDRVKIAHDRIPFEGLEKKLLIFPYSGLITGIVKAAVDIEDDFPVDNTAYLSLSASKDIWVLLVSKGNYFLEKLLKAYPNVMVNSVKKIIPSSWKEQTTRHDIVIIDRMDFPATEKGNFLLIDSYSRSLPVLKTDQIDFPEILDWDKKSPLMANVDVAGLTVEKAAKLQADDILKPVIESSQTGLMYAYEENGLRAVFLGFDITRSDLPLKVAFPVMMSNIINWLNPHKLNFSLLQARAGEPFDIYLHPETEHFTTRAPREKWEKHQVTTNPFTYFDTKKVGIYTISEKNKRRYFSVNLADESESDIKAPAIDLSPITYETGSDTEKRTTQHPLWTFLLLSGLAVMLGEWYLWLKIG